MDEEKIGKFIRTLRKEKNLTQDELADKLYITRENISKWERGVTIPNTTYLKELCAILDISINELLSGERSKEIKTNNSKVVLILSTIVVVEAIIIIFILLKK